MSIVMKTKVMGGILLRFPTENEEAVFKSLLLDRQFRFNPKCKLIAPLSEEYWKEFVVSDGRAFLPIEIDSFNYLDAKLLFDRKPYKAIIGTSFDGFLSPQCEVGNPHFELQIGKNRTLPN